MLAGMGRAQMRVSKPAGQGAGLLPGRRVHPGVEAAIERSRGRGRPLDTAVRERVAPAVGDRLQDVEVHTDALADALARAVSARAFTVGTDVFFGRGEYRPRTAHGDALLVHELAHVAQQRGAPASGPLRVTAPGGALETQADAVAGGLTAGPSVTAAPAPSATGEGGRMLARSPVAMTQPGFATGDQFGIVAALLGDRELEVYISKSPTGEGHDSRDKADDIRQFYIDSGVAARRIHVVNVDRFPGYDEMEDAAWGTRRFRYVFGVGHGTDWVAKNFTAGSRETIRNAWQLGVRRDMALKAWLEAKGLRVPSEPGNTKVLVLWSRFSGKKGEIHMEHDTSYAGMRQIIAAAKAAYDAIIIVGDKGWGPQKSQKYVKIADDANEGLEHKKVFNLAEFWTDTAPANREQPQGPRVTDPTLALWQGNTRMGQFKLYDYLDRKFGTVKHLGFRSGNLEALALMGIKNVRYMEEPGSEGGERMAKWHARGQTGKTEAQFHLDEQRNRNRIAPGYERLLISGSPTRSGKIHLRYQQNPWRGDSNKKRPLWAAKKRDSNSTKLEQINYYVSGSPSYRQGISQRAFENLRRGFTDDDLRAIKGYLGV